MGLKDYVVPTTIVTLATDNLMSVRGLNFADITKLVHDHGPALILIYGKVYAEATAGTLDSATVGKLIQTTMAETPELIADIIAIAADEPSAAAKAKRLPPGVQLEAMLAIVGHTFVSEAELKKLVETVTTMLEKAGGLAAMLTSDKLSTDGSGESESA